MHRRHLVIVPIILLAGAWFLGALAARPIQATGALSSGIVEADGHWLQFASPVTESLRAIDMLSATSGWAGGIGPTLLRYSNGNWSKVDSPIITNGVSAIDALSDSRL